MRQTILIIALIVAGAIALSLWQPGASVPLPTPTRTPLPDGFTLIPTFVPDYPCQLQQADVYDEALCRRESIQQRVLAQTGDTVFIRHDYHLGAGCWGSISHDLHELRVCSRASGTVTLLTDELTSDLLPSPDGAWYAFGTMTRTTAFDPHVYRVRPDGTGMERLDAQGFPEQAVGAPLELRWLDADWLALTLWDGTEGGYHAYRLRADGSGHYEPLPPAISMPNR